MFGTAPLANLGPPPRCRRHTVNGSNRDRELRDRSGLIGRQPDRPMCSAVDEQLLEHRLVVHDRARQQLVAVVVEDHREVRFPRSEIRTRYVPCAALDS